MLNHSIFRTFSRLWKYKNWNFSSTENFLCSKIVEILLHKNFSVDEKFWFLHFWNLQNVLITVCIISFGSSKNFHRTLSSRVCLGCIAWLKNYYCFQIALIKKCILCYKIFLNISWFCWNVFSKIKGPVLD